MKWVKANERLPDKKGSYYIIDHRYNDRRSNCWFSPNGKNGNSLIFRYTDKISWLDESSPPTPTEGEGKSMEEILREHGMNPPESFETESYWELYDDMKKAMQQYANSRTEKLVEALETISENLILGNYKKANHTTTEALK